MECEDAPRHPVRAMEATPGKTPQVAGRSIYITERMIDAHGPTDRCRKCSTGYGTHSVGCRQRFESIQYDLLQEKLKQAPAIPEARGEQTVVTLAPVASEVAPGAAASRSFLEDQALGEAARTSPSSPDIVMEDVPVSSSGALCPPGTGEVPAQERPEPGDMDEQMRAKETPDVKKPRAAAIGALTVCVFRAANPSAAGGGV